MNQKLIHIVGGGENQIHLIKQGKQSGYKTLVTDMFENSPGKKYADFYAQINTRDIENTFRASREYKIDAITTDGTDVAVPTVAYIADQMGLSGVGYNTALCFTNKFQMREKLKQKQIPMPHYQFFEDVESCFSFIKHATIKYIIKPVNSQGSKGVFVLDHLDREKILKSFAESNGNGVIVEEYIAGPQYSVEAITLNGKVFSLAISQIEFFVNSNVGRKIKYFNEIDDSTVRRLFSANKKVINSLNLQNGITHGEYRIHKDSDIFLIEIACRGGGAGINAIAVPYLTKLNTSQILIDLAFGNPIDLNFEDYRLRKMLIEFFCFKPGKINHIKVDNKIHDYAEFYKLNVGNLEISPVVDSRDRYGQFIVTGDTKEEINRKVSKVYDCIDIAYG